MPKFYKVMLFKTSGHTIVIEGNLQNNKGRKLLRKLKIIMENCFGKFGFKQMNSNLREYVRKFIKWLYRGVWCTDQGKER